MLLDVSLLCAIAFFISAILVWMAILLPARGSWIRLPPSPMALPIIGHLHLLNTVPYKSFHKLSTHYGPLIQLRLGSVPCIVASSPELAKELLMKNDLTFSSRAIPMAVHHLTYKSSGFAFSPFGSQWKFMKKLCMSDLLGGRPLAQLLPIRRDELHQLVQLFVNRSDAGETLNISEELVRLSNNIISRMMLSLRYSGKDDQAEEARILTREVTEIFGYFNYSDFIGAFRNFDLQGLFKRSKDTHRRYNILLERIINEREEHRGKSKEEMGDGDGVKDFLDVLLDVYEDEKAEVRLTRNHIKAFVLDIFTAGTDTSAAATEWALSEVINNPIIFERAREEIDMIVGKNSLVEESDIPNLPYIQAIIKESLRLHPPIPLIGRVASQDCKIAGYDVPAKTSLFLNVWSMGRDPNNWKDPLEFRPERFMPSQDNEVESMSTVTDVRGQHFNLLPFGTGRRVCPGISLAMQQVPTVLAALVQCFDWKVTGHKKDPIMLNMDERPGLTVPRAHPLILIPIARSIPFIKTVNL
ncbi:hypothetical protein IFM89_008462 [Coptis chinensis]|uniref:Cytochrome P450 n=1 Tax=Coptis chinensis TaxID=261450 RepID=A0A835H4W5_9MAGN|nr:hypothetical protein IFM89_008462 [Coptis chinensis]